ncbi:methyltransferase family protein [Tahibacter aquaticus]|uniref:Methyltransferase family protein n=1 Tax=Tahibacter aquaticus TaxID=520092 RepID=A0A4R6Z286_9GAMM|nr:class I SAM-dependent methyltransferase [Tahibacter aquaticus]TDR45604.1 methyltransferase family protein [Tahibacter aquaticus]
MTSTSTPASTNTADTSDHWEQVYRTRPSDEVSWYRPHLERSLSFIQAASPDHHARILDVGGGASTLVDDLVAQGYQNLSVLDLAEAALQQARDRLGESASAVKWISADVRTVSFDSHSIDLWHDRAVFHFLTDEADRASYVRQVTAALKPGGHLVIATFAPDGPTRCSGLEVVRYDATGLAQVFGQAFRLEAQAADAHTTPNGNTQSFVYCRFVRVA